MAICVMQGNIYHGKPLSAACASAKPGLSQEHVQVIACKQPVATPAEWVLAMSAGLF
jgi:hypothetical protein